MNERTCTKPIFLRSDSRKKTICFRDRQVSLERDHLVDASHVETRETREDKNIALSNGKRGSMADCISEHELAGCFEFDDEWWCTTCTAMSKDRIECHGTPMERIIEAGSVNIAEIDPTDVHDDQRRHAASDSLRKTLRPSRKPCSNTTLQKLVPYKRSRGSRCPSADDKPRKKPSLYERTRIKT